MAERDVLQRQGVSDRERCIGTGKDLRSDSQTLGGYDVALLSIGIEHEGDVRTPVGIILDGLHGSGNTVLVPLEVDDPVGSLVTTAPSPDGDAAERVTTSLLCELSRKALLRLRGCDLVEGEDSLLAKSRSIWFIGFQCHFLFSSYAFEGGNGLALGQSHDCLLPGGCGPLDVTALAS